MDKPYQTGGGRTIDANVIDIMITWMVNNDREFLQGGSASRDEARHQDVSLRGFAEYAVADRSRQCRPCGLSGSGLGSHRAVWRHVASIDRQD